MVSAVIVTRGDVDLAEPLNAIEDAGIDEIAVWDNSTGTDLAVYGRYAAIEQLTGDLVYTQDDDCVVEPGKIKLLVDYAGDDRETIYANMPVSRWDDYPDSCLVGWGAVYGRDLPQRAFERFARGVRFGLVGSAAFYRECDVVFTTLTPHRKINLGFRHLPWAEDPKRAMFLNPRPDRPRILELARRVRDAG